MKFLLLLGALATLDTVSVIAGPVPDRDAAIVPRAEQGTEAAQANGDTGLDLSSLDLNDFFSDDDSDDDDEVTCTWYWCPKPEKQSKCTWWWWCKSDDDDDDDEPTPISWYGDECPDPEYISCDTCGGFTWWDGKTYASKGLYPGCECS